MFDCHKQINSFYDKKVYLTDEQKKQLRDFRDKNLKRVHDGIKKIEEESGKKQPKYVSDLGQGSMAMHTINQTQHNDDQDIDHALIYDASEINDCPKKAKEFVANAINKAAGNFKTPPEARTNAVTVWYDDGYHVDFAIYRKSQNMFGQEILEHAGSEWKTRDPSAITNWFLDSNKSLSPDPEDQIWKPTVRTGQLRRVTRLLKYWSKSRSGWSLPSGLVVSALVVENYKPDNYRDDKAFYNTICGIRDRLRYNRDVLNPTDRSKSLLVTQLHKNQIDSLFKRLEKWIGKLDDLKLSNVTETKAKSIWGIFFKSSWWTELPKPLKKSETSLAAFEFLSVSILASDKNGRKKFIYDPNGTGTIPKKMNIQFVARTNIPRPYLISWEVRNKGDEAKWHKQGAPRNGLVDKTDMHMCNETSGYRGNHFMICRLHKNSQLLEEKSLEIRIR